MGYAMIVPINHSFSQSIPQQVQIIILTIVGGNATVATIRQIINAHHAQFVVLGHIALDALGQVLDPANLAIILNNENPKYFTRYKKKIQSKH